MSEVPQQPALRLKPKLRVEGDPAPKVPEVSQAAESSAEAPTPASPGQNEIPTPSGSPAVRL